VTLTRATIVSRLGKAVTQVESPSFPLKRQP
jgi:hypothetical protein